MPYVVTDACVKDFVCASECAVGAIAPLPGAANADSVTQVYIDPEACIECGNCATLCEQNAIYVVEDLPADKAEFAAKNAAHFQ